jgi:hypothetical protein
MKMWSSVLLLLLSLGSLAQKRGHRAAYDEEEVSPRLLSKKIIAGARTEGEKVDAIMQWISGNIAYNTGVLYPIPRKAPILFPAPVTEDTGALAPLNDRVAENVLRRRVAVCDGYARLFASLCSYAGIQAELVTGYVRPDRGRVLNRFRSNHTWNAVRIDSAWHLVDATWASGYVTFGNEFVPHYNSFYYRTDPRDFIRDHYPENLRWTLLPEAPALNEFWDAPFRYQAFLKFNIRNFAPTTGVIEVAPGDTFQIHIESMYKGKSLVITTEPITEAFIDSLERNTPPPPVTDGNVVRGSYIVKANEGSWLHVLFNNEPILRYRLLESRRVTKLAREF